MLAPAADGAKRVLERLEGVYGIGGGCGANRPGLSGGEQEAHDLVAAWMEEAGLRVDVDAAGNLWGTLAGTQPELPAVWTGSHVDSVPEGGRFDGVLGVVGGIEAVAAVTASGRPARTLAVVAYRDEDGSRFGRGFFGSRALSGLLAHGELEARDADGVSVREALARLGFRAPAPGGWLREPPRAFLECHVEQGPVLALAEMPLGVPTGIVGIARGEPEFRGVAGHAGTTPMRDRADALCSAAELVLRARDAAGAIEGAVATVGRLTVEPGAINVVPGRVRATVDARAPDRARFEALLAALPEADVRVLEPIELSEEPRTALRRELEARALPLVELASGAGHDAGILASAGVPSALLFVRSLAGGASHSPEEESSEDDVALALEVLAGAVARLAAA